MAANAHLHVSVGEFEGGGRKGKRDEKEEDGKERKGNGMMEEMRAQEKA